MGADSWAAIAIIAIGGVLVLRHITRGPCEHDTHSGCSRCRGRCTSSDHPTPKGGPL